MGQSILKFVKAALVVFGISGVVGLAAWLGFGDAVKPLGDKINYIPNPFAVSATAL